MSIEAMVRELMHTYEKTGKIGRTKPRNKAHALQIALAIAHERKGKSRE